MLKLEYNVKMRALDGLAVKFLLLIICNLLPQKRLAPLFQENKEFFYEIM